MADDFHIPAKAIADSERVLIAKFKGKIRNGKMSARASHGERFKLTFRNLTADTAYITGTVKGSGGSCGLRFSKF